MCTHDEWSLALLRIRTLGRKTEQEVEIYYNNETDMTEASIDNADLIQLQSRQLSTVFHCIHKGDKFPLTYWWADIKNTCMSTLLTMDMEYSGFAG